MASRGMPCDRHPREINWVFSTQCLEVFRGSQDIVKRTRPPAALISHTAIFDVPCRGTGFCQSGAQVACMPEIVGRSPKATMNEHHERVGALTLRHAQIAELIGIRAVSQASIRFGWGEFENTLRL